MKKADDKIYSLEDVAQALGVSKTTVSRAISGKGRIGAETRERVLEFISEHDYRPNAVARGFAQRKTYNIGLMLPMDYAVTELQFFKECMNGAYEAAVENGYDILLTLQEGSSLENLERLIKNRKVDGIIVSRAVENSAAQSYLVESGTPFLVIGAANDPKTATVDNPNREGAKELTNYLRKQGFRKFALLGGEQTYHVTKSRLEGFLDAFENGGSKEEETLIFQNILSREDTAAALEHAAQAGADCIVCMDDRLASLAVGCIRKTGWRIPEDVAVASMYDSPELEDGGLDVTAVRFDTWSLGRQACCQLLRILGEQEIQEEEQENYRIIPRKSTRREDPC